MKSVETVFRQQRQQPLRRNRKVLFQFAAAESRDLHLNDNLTAHMLSSNHIVTFISINVVSTKMHFLKDMGLRPGMAWTEASTSEASAWKVTFALWGHELSAY